MVLQQKKDVPCLQLSKGLRKAKTVFQWDHLEDIIRSISISNALVKISVW